MEKQFVKVISTIMGQINVYINDIIINITISFCESEAQKSSCQQLWFFISFNMDKGISGLEMNSSIKQRRVKKKWQELFYIFSMIKFQALRVNSFTDIFKCFLIKCRTTFIEKKYEWLSLTVNISNIINFYVFDFRKIGKLENFKSIVLRSLVKYSYYISRFIRCRRYRLGNKTTCNDKLDIEFSYFSYRLLAKCFEENITSIFP